MDSVSCQARCLLVDHGERLVVPSDQIRIAMQNFLQLPFWVRSASTQWDSSSTLYMHSLLQASTRTEAVLLESEADSTSIELYLTICLNDDLVAKKFAYYSRESADSREMDEEDQLPVMLSSSILTQTASSKPTAHTQSPTGLTTPQVSSSAHGVSVSPLDNIHASSPLTSLLLQSQHELQPREDGSRSKVTEEHLSEKGAAEGLCESSQVECIEDEGTSLLEWLNPEPVNPESDTAHNAVLKKKQCSVLTPAERYSWPSVARGCNTPMAVLLCPGWEKVMVMMELLEEMKLKSVLQPYTLLLGVGKDEAKAVRIPKNCLLLVTTPFSLMRLLSGHCFLFLRLYHLKVTSSEEKTSCPQQLVAVAKRWTNHFEALLANHMPYPCIVVTTPEEAALYGNVQQNNKISVLLGSLDFNSDVGQKTLIVANSAQEVEDVFKAVSNKSAFCLKTHEGLTHQFDFVVQQWRKDIGPGTHRVSEVFGDQRRHVCRPLRLPHVPQRSDRSPRLTRSVLLISERNACHVVGVLRYLERTKAPLPPELLDFARGVHMAREEQKTHKPLCGYIKSYGVCRDSSVCPDRHTIVSELDQSVLPASGVIEVVPLYVKTASVFYGRIVRKEDGGFQNMASEMKDFYADKNPGSEDPVRPRQRRPLVLHGVCPIHRCGEGGGSEVHQILKLPERFHSLPGQAVEIIVCRVKPVDAETDWHPKRISVMDPEGSISLCYSIIRHTFVLAQHFISAHRHLRISHTTLNSHVTLHNIRSGNGSVSLEVRIEAEQDVLAEALADLPHLEPFEPLSPDSSTIQSLVPVPPVPPVLDLHLAPVSDQRPLMVNQSAGGERNTHSADLRIRLKLSDFNTQDRRWRTSPMISKSVLMECRQNGVSTGEDESGSQQLISSNETHCGDAVKSFHPPARWYQTSDSLIVTMKLKEPQNQSCHFFQDRVVGRVNERTYRADLQLHANIAPDRCCWEMKSNEPVLKLFKQQPGHWEKLLRNKNIFVSYDMEHIELRMKTEPQTENMGGNDNCYVVSESGSESD
ncbi:hypothetical protein F7725_023363 [Dissostichus mawsoni]|uniref:RNA helicase n=1 Tax=Dissostichus mawsoni TaxID=36200 RepID=A0A7J5Z4S9_DISMA|nr:hypothetical protein F7725_023363 [Dissostichus mawsoni]